MYPTEINGRISYPYSPGYAKEHAVFLNTDSIFRLIWVDAADFQGGTMQIDSNIATLLLQKQLLLLVYSNYSDIIDDTWNILFKSFHLLNKIPKPIFCGDLNKILFSTKNFSVTTSLMIIILSLTN